MLLLEQGFLLNHLSGWQTFHTNAQFETLLAKL